ncbi:hypothetical protein EMN47_12420 [Prolixibacteraceae bacterium JC049]|nr:hypothetical protein [Prolixibacteraceae bacterium JC049]
MLYNEELGGAFEEYDDAMNHLRSDENQEFYNEEFQEFEDLIIDESRPYTQEELDNIADVSDDI